MFADCSEISINLIVKHVQHIGIITAFYLLEGNCSNLFRQKKLLGCGLLGGISTFADAMLHTTKGGIFSFSQRVGMNSVGIFLLVIHSRILYCFSPKLSGFVLCAVIILS